LGPLLAALLLAGLLAAPVGARAADSPATRWPVGGSRLALASDLGSEHWGTAPCRGRVALSWASLGAATNAESSWANAVDPFRAPSRNSDCAIALSLQADWDWPKLCTVVIHELGHLTGHDHVDDPADVMYDTYLVATPDCAATPEPAETGAPAVVAPSPTAADTAPRRAGKRPAPRRGRRATATKRRTTSATRAKRAARAPARDARHR
jgi:hypothetical protein